MPFYGVPDSGKGPENTCRIGHEKIAPKIHHLRRLAEMAQLDLTGDEWKLLARASDFNMEARYPDEKLEFHKLSDKEYKDTHYEAIISLYKKSGKKNHR